MNTDAGAGFLAPLMSGAGMTAQIFAYSAVLTIAIAFLAGFGRMSKHTPIRIATAVYVEFFRGTSLMIQLFWLYFALPLLGFELTPMAAGLIAMGCNYGAYGSEIVRSSIQAVPKGQIEAAIALNMTPFQRMKKIVLPQAVVMMLPAFGNLLIELLKGTSLVSLITLADLTFKGMLLRTFDISSTPQILGLLLIMYFVMAAVVTLGVRLLEKFVTAGRT
ncbi:ectoine/hydroxyectoine ABC transporter permease subunit EhuC [Brevibacillus sp. B_LB10_24]|uniref:ectoine/hydroxyectoine ABC transporter permease subunit EhuC n=1 Tax=Brevibacillus sp. B_LB10_24 TaxID=3380645 RepID=UPI0038BC783E